MAERRKKVDREAPILTAAEIDAEADLVHAPSVLEDAATAWRSSAPRAERDLLDATLVEDDDDGV